MASGRLGSTSLAGTRAGVLYTNSSGGAVSLSVMAKVKSSTANVPLSFWIDSSSTAPEVSTQISSSNFTKVTNFLSLNAGNTAVDFRIDKIGNATDYIYNNYIDSSGTVIGNYTGANMPFDTDLSLYTGWIAPHWYVPGSALTVAAFYTRATLSSSATIQKEFFKLGCQYSSSSSNSSYSASASYFNRGTSFDPYCVYGPVFGINNSGYMAYYASSNGTSVNLQSTRAGNSLYRERITTASPNTSINGNQYFSANGGIMWLGSSDSLTQMFVLYGRTPLNTTVTSRVIYGSDANQSTTSQPFYIKFVSDDWSSITTYNDFFKFLQHNPTTLKTYWLGNMVGKGMRFLEFDTVKMEAATLVIQNTGGTANLGNSDQSYDTIVGFDWVTDITDLPTTPAIFKNSDNNVQLVRPMQRIGTNLWRIDLYDATTSTYYSYSTTDIKTDWSLITYTDNYDQADALGANIISTGSVTNRIVNNTPALADSGIVEYQTSVNQYERTGLVVSNGDRVVLSNGGSTVIAAQAMGYEA